MSLRPKIGNSIISRKGMAGSAPFSITHSFLLDGVNEYFIIPNEDLDTHLTGVNKQYGLTNLVRRSSIGTAQAFIGGNNFGILGRFEADNTIKFWINTSSGIKTIQTTNSFSSTTIWYFIEFVYDGVTPANSKIFVNGVDESIASNDLLSDIVDTGTDWTIGSREGNNFFNGYVSQYSLTTGIKTLLQHQTHYNGGTPLNPQTEFGANCVWHFNPDNSNNNAQFVVTDTVNSVTATSTQMEDADKTTVTPY